MSVKFNNNPCDLGDQAYESEGTTGYTYKQLSFGNVTLNAGTNVLEITMLANDDNYFPYIDDLQFFADEALTVTTVQPPMIEVAVSDVALAVGGTSQIVTETTGVSYESSNTAVATVSDAGLITAVAAGGAYITVSKAGMRSTGVYVMVGDAFSGAQLQIEVENCALGGGITTRTASTGETIINAWPKNAAIKVIFNSSVTGSYALSLNARAGRTSSYSSTTVDSVIGTDLIVKVNGVEITPTVTISGNSFADYALGNISVVSGINVIELVNKGTGPAIDYFKIAPSA